ncbi:hypothetical protein IGK74_002333 [Enterococcus sp. AZ150]|uniref:hypothetical protein n=1 Tax=Enterococcus sp. AZ150 TaxID=2774866 RepID=UPI003F20DB42
MKKTFNNIKIYLSINVIQRKVIFLSVLIFAWLFLLLGAIFSPNKQLFTNEQLSTQKRFENGTGEINLLSQIYSPENHIIMLEFQTKDTTSSVNLGINNDNLKWELFSPNKNLKSEMEVIPITDGKIKVIISNVPEEFKALAISITNNESNTNSIKIEPDVEKDTTSSIDSNTNDTEENNIQFFISSKNPELKQKHIQKNTREEYVEEALKEEINFQDSQIKDLKKSIAALTNSISSDEEKIKTLKSKNDYLTGNDKEKNNADIDTLQNSIRNKKDQIDQIEKSIAEIEDRISGIEKNIDDIKNGNYQFNDVIKSAKLK